MNKSEMKKLHTHKFHNYMYKGPSYDVIASGVKQSGLPDNSITDCHAALAMTVFSLSSHQEANSHRGETVLMINKDGQEGACNFLQLTLLKETAYRR